MVDLPLSPSTAAAALAASGNNSRYGNKLVEPPKELEGSKRDAEKSSSSSSSVLPLHDVYPESKWINYWIKNEKDVPQVISLFRLQYDRLTKARN
jgi:hypothetical protein